ncbi:glycosyltransferase family 8 protein [Kushneria konosiri]|uniref:Glycosyl transferase n=1 Tax=Kushneria konosiri TaxID=698828 RepID=A0A2Z2H3F0_9GAMM|nr:glycosyltransferase family 8 protein [Kushneria konosiri]ARS51729.1 hypothetical protein B9G99_01500 [Kushneria konosiri]
MVFGLLMMKADQLNVVLASDDNYALWMGVVMFSCLEKNLSKKNMCFYVIDGGISKDNKDKIEKMAGSYQSSVQWITPCGESLQGLPIKRYGIATYYRLLLGQLLPQHVSKVIYLDCDLLIADDLKCLWEHDLSGHVLGAVENLGIASPSLNLERQQYFNAGVLLIDMYQWREKGTDDKLITVMKKAGDKYRYLDQDALNTIFKYSWSRLPLRWNIQPSFWSKIEKSKWNITGYKKEDYFLALEKPGAIHFLAKSKPWNYMVFHPYKEVYKSLFETIFPKQTFYKDVSFKENLKKLTSFGKALKNQRRIRRSKKIFYDPVK